MTAPEGPSRYRTLPEPMRPEELVETVDVSEHHEIDAESDERARLLRNAGGGLWEPVSAAGGCCPAGGR